jgi:hypothetical protein
VNFDSRAPSLKVRRKSEIGSHKNVVGDKGTRPRIRVLRNGLEPVKDCGLCRLDQRGNVPRRWPELLPLPAPAFPVRGRICPSFLFITGSYVSPPRHRDLPHRNTLDVMVSARSTHQHSNHDQRTCEYPLSCAAEADVFPPARPLMLQQFSKFFVWHHFLQTNVDGR